jgi:trk system potassium uptake protein TrkH
VERATAVLILFSVIAILSLMLLLVVEQNGGSHASGNASFIEAAFEVVSALGTVGLSIGMTPELSESGRLIIIVLMFTGRLGPITVFVALSGNQRRDAIEYPHEEPLIG